MGHGYVGHQPILVRGRKNPTQGRCASLNGAPVPKIFDDEALTGPPATAFDTQRNQDTHPSKSRSCVSCVTARIL